MALPKKVLALLLILVALTASLESMPRYLVASLAVPSPASGPTNESPYGTKLLVQLVEDMGYNVSLVYGPESLLRLDAREVGIVLVAPYRLTDEYLNRLVEAVDSLASRGVLVHLLVADEVNETVNRVIERFHSRLCRFAPQPSIGELMRQDSVKAVFYTGHETVEAVTGRTSYVIVSGVEPVRGINPPPPLVKPGPVTTWGIYAYAWPAGDPLPPLSWYPLAYKCWNIRAGSESIVADSTLFINSMISAENGTRKAVEAIIEMSLGGPRQELVVVFDQEPYVDPAMRADLRLRFHPSFILTLAATLYKQLEERAFQIMSSHYPAMLAASLLASIVALSLLPSWTRGGGKRRKRRGKGGWIGGGGLYCGVAERVARERGLKMPLHLSLRCRLARSSLGLLRRLGSGVEGDALRWLVSVGWTPLDEARS